MFNQTGTQREEDGSERLTFRTLGLCGREVKHLLLGWKLLHGDGVQKTQSVKVFSSRNLHVGQEPWTHSGTPKRAIPDLTKIQKYK